MMHSHMLERLISQKEKEVLILVVMDDALALSNLSYVETAIRLS